jgi:hypothetical protein
MFLYHFKNFYPGVGRDRLIEVGAQFRIVASLGYLLVNSSVKRNQESLLRSRQVADALTEQCGHKTFQISWFWADNGQTGQNCKAGSDHGLVARRPQIMKQKPRSRVNRKKAKTVLRLPDLEHAKAAVLNSLTSVDAQRGYRHAIDEFVDWYCSEPRLAFNRIVVLRYRSYLESLQLAPGTVNLRLGAVRRLAYEAADCGLLSSDLAAGIRRVKGVKKLGVRLGNWLSRLTLFGKRPIARVSKGSGTEHFLRCCWRVG